jgi:small GTP-binding protein
MSGKNSDSIYKYIVIGDSRVGKTKIINRFVNNYYDDNYQPTVGVDFQTQYFDFNNKRLKIQWWDAGGNEKYRSIVSAYFRSSAGIIAVYDITLKKTFDSLKIQLNCLKKHLLIEKPTVFIIGNKVDLEDDRQVCFEEATDYANLNGFFFKELSAKTTFNINDILNELIKESLFKKEIRCNSARNHRNEKYSLPRLDSVRSSRSANLIDARSNSFLFSSTDSLRRKNSTDGLKFNEVLLFSLIKTIYFQIFENCILI